MLELQALRAGVVGCYARSEALDALTADVPLAIRVAPDELLMLVEIDEAIGHLAAAERSLAVLDPGGLALDVSAGFAVFRLRGDWPEAFARLCAAPLPESPACIQALFAHVPAKVVVTTDELLVVVSSVVSHHIRDRILTACRDLDPCELEAALAATWSAGAT